MILVFFRPMLQLFSVLVPHPYIAHGYLGAEILRAEGFPQHALVCERHTGAGLSLEDIIAQQLPVPHREMLPITLEEQLICFADKFFSKTHLDEEKTVEKARKSIAKYGEEGLSRFDRWCSLFLLALKNKLNNEDSNSYLVKFVYFCHFKRKLLVNGAIESKNTYIIHTADCLTDASR